MSHSFFVPFWTFLIIGGIFSSAAAENLTQSAANLIDWASLRRNEYEDMYVQISTPDFLSQFSMKRGYRLEPYFPLVFPNDGDVFSQLSATPEGRITLSKISEIQQDINLTLYEIHREQTLLPSRRRAYENHLPVTYEIRAKSFMPVSFILSDAALFQHLSAAPTPASVLLAASSARQTGALEFRVENDIRTINAFQISSLILLPAAETCAILDRLPVGQDADVATEIQLPSATVTLRENAAPELGIGAVSYENLILITERVRYSASSRQFFHRFESLGGKILEK